MSFCCGLETSKLEVFMEGRKNIKKHRKNKTNTSSNIDCGPKYSKVSESLRYVTSGSVQCSMFCGGRSCKYESSAKWSDAEMAIKGLYSSWVTDYILAMARPSTRILKEFDIISQFQRWGITAVINLQHPGEHANCGFGLEKDGFTYNPQVFMDNGIFFYNFIWQDYGVRSLESVLDMVKVMDFALQEGRVSVHCHAGLGRTGVLIACYLIFSQRMSPEQAIHTVRIKRPKSVQTRGQIACVQDFAQYLQPLWVVFSSCYAFGVKPFTLQKYLVRQRHMLHGYEARKLKYTPKIIFVVCKRLLEISGLDSCNLKITEDRGVDQNDEELVENDYDSDITNSLDIGGQITSNISASLEDLKGECDISVNNAVCDKLNRGLSNSQPSGLISYKEGTPLLLPQPLRKSDSVLYHPNNKLVGELQIEKENYERERPSEDKSGSEDNPTLDVVSCEQSKKTELTNSSKLESVRNEEHGNNNAELSAKALSSESQLDDKSMTQIKMLQRILNEFNDGWESVEAESNATVLSALMFSWINNLTEPVLSTNDVQTLVYNGDDPQKALLNLNKEQRGICECLFVTIFKLNPISKELRDKALWKIITILTQTKNATSGMIQTETKDQNDDVVPSEIGGEGSSLISDFFKYLMSLYKNFLNNDK